MRGRKTSVCKISSDDEGDEVNDRRMNTERRRQANDNLNSFSHAAPGAEGGRTGEFWRHWSDHDGVSRRGSTRGF